MLIPIEINGKKYDVVDSVTLNNKDYIIYEDKDNIYVNAYTMEDDKINILEITEEEKEMVIKEIELWKNIHYLYQIKI